MIRNDFSSLHSRHFQNFIILMVGEGRLIFGLSNWRSLLAICRVLEVLDLILFSEMFDGFCSCWLDSQDNAMPFHNTFWWQWSSWNWTILRLGWLISSLSGKLGDHKLCKVSFSELNRRFGGVEFCFVICHGMTYIFDLFVTSELNLIIIETKPSFVYKPMLSW